MFCGLFGKRTFGASIAKTFTLIRKIERFIWWKYSFAKKGK